MFICLLATLVLLIFGYNFALYQMQKIVNLEIRPALIEWNNNCQWRAVYVPTYILNGDLYLCPFGIRDVLALMVKKAFYQRVPGSLKVYKKKRSDSASLQDPIKWIFKDNDFVLHKSQI